MSLTGRGPQLRHGHDGEAQEGVRLADLLSLVPHLKQNLTAPARDLTEISVIRKKMTNRTKQRMSYSCDRLVFKGLNFHPFGTFRYTDASKQGGNDVIMMLLNCVT